MTDEELEKLTGNTIITTEVTKDVRHMLNIVSKITNMDQRSVDILSFEGIKKAVDHELAYLAEKEEKSSEPLEFKAKYTYHEMIRDAEIYLQKEMLSLLGQIDQRLKDLQKSLNHD